MSGGCRALRSMRAAGLSRVLPSSVVDYGWQAGTRSLQTSDKWHTEDEKGVAIIHDSSTTGVSHGAGARAAAGSSPDCRPGRIGPYRPVRNAISRCPAQSTMPCAPSARSAGRAGSCSAPIRARRSTTTTSRSAFGIPSFVTSGWRNAGRTRHATPRRPSGLPPARAPSGSR